MFLLCFTAFTQFKSNSQDWFIFNHFKNVINKKTYTIIDSLQFKKEFLVQHSGNWCPAVHELMCATCACVCVCASLCHRLKHGKSPVFCIKWCEMLCSIYSKSSLFIMILHINMTIIYIKVSETTMTKMMTNPTKVSLCTNQQYALFQIK